MSDYKQPKSDGEIAFTKFLEEYSTSIIPCTNDERLEEVLCARKRFSEDIKQDVKEYLLQEEQNMIAQKALEIQKESWLKKKKRDIVIVTVEVAILGFLIGLLINAVTTMYFSQPDTNDLLLFLFGIAIMLSLLSNFYINDLFDKIEETTNKP